MGPDRFDETRGGSKMLAFDVVFSTIPIALHSKIESKQIYEKKGFAIE